MSGATCLIHRGPGRQGACRSLRLRSIGLEAGEQPAGGAGGDYAAHPERRRNARYRGWGLVNLFLSMKRGDISPATHEIQDAEPIP